MYDLFFSLANSQDTCKTFTKETMMTKGVTNIATNTKTGLDKNYQIVNSKVTSQKFGN